MRKAITINIPEPCHEDWNKMTPKEKGRHCSACNKTVIDFTKQTDVQIIKTFESSGKLCGRFKVQQLNREIVLTRKSKNSYLSWAASGLFAFLAFGNQDIHAQSTQKTVQTDSIKIPRIKGKIATSILKEKIVSGKVTTASDALPLPGASVIVKGTLKSQQTDFDGLFNIKANVGDTLVFNYVGMESLEIKINENFQINAALKENYDLSYIVVGYSTISSEKAFIKKLKRIDKRKEKRKAIKNGEQERTLLGKFFFGIKSLFSKKEYLYAYKHK